ncbi:MAG: hypothetical protein AAB209_02925 [Bacteroidota bacterium]
MKLNATLLALLVLAIETFAQPQSQQEANVISQRGSLQIQPLYQRWSLDSSAFSEASSVLSVYQPVSRSASLSLYGSFGSASGDVTPLRGLTDVQLSGNYYLESANLVFSLGVGIPSGKKKLAPDEFLTSILLTNNVFRLQVPHFGAGFSLSPGVIWALPLSDDFVVGLGATFQYRGPFSPLQNFGTYDPGEEVSGTIGLDVRVDETSTLSADVVYTRYGKDKLDGVEALAPGDKVFAALQFKKYFNMDQLLFLATYRTKAKAEIAPGFLQPNQAELFTAYTAHFTDRFAMQFSFEGRFFQETSAPFSGFRLLGAGVTPEFTISDNLTIPLRFKYTYGKGPNDAKLSGIDAGVGIVLSY